MNPTIQQVNADGTAVLLVTENITPDQVNQRIESINGQIALFNTQIQEFQSKLSFYTDIQVQQQRAITNIATPAESQVITP